MKISKKMGISLAILVAGFVSFLAAEQLLYKTNAILGVKRSGQPDAVLQGEGLPPQQAFVALVLGGFRGLLADALWMRASRLQDQGRFLEMVQLARWITQLEPQFTETWVYHAWNMAYNISGLFSDFPDRWRWVQNGLRLLRDEGVRWNPDDPQMYWEVGWIYLNKIGGSYDTASPYYRRELAHGMEAILPGGRYRPEWVTADPTVRERLLSEYRLDPRIMDIVKRRFGDLDWRLPETHAVYWAVCGLAAAGEKGSLPCERLIYTSMIELFRRGNLVISPDGENLFRFPDLDLVLSALRSLESAMAQPGREYLNDLHASFLGDAILFSVAFDQPEQAQALWELYRSRHPHRAAASSPDEFAHRYATRRMQSVSPAAAVSMIFDGWAQSERATGAGLESVAAGYRRWTEMLWTAWLGAQRPETRPADPVEAYRQIQREALKQVRTELTPAWRSRLVP